MKKFYNDGISKIKNIADEDLSGLFDNLKAVREVSQEYTSYSGISDDMDGIVKFIYTFDGTD